MPHMTGEDLVRKILSIRADIPVILCTGFSERIRLETAEAIGIKAFLKKPVTKSEMARTVRRVLDNS
ncbi:MAG: response regulator [Deltaproteobacteria bacterium]|nr:response regulator [Deltaproteobacteria bacterium]